MISKCPKCGRTVPEDSVYCPYCGYGIKPSAKTTQVWVGGTAMIIASVASLIFFILSINALIGIYSWYPPGVAQIWIVYDQMLTIFSFMGFLFGLSAGILSLTRRRYKLTMMFAIMCTLSGACAWIVSMVIPFASMWYSFYNYFLPLVVLPAAGTALIFPRKAEFTR